MPGKSRRKRGKHPYQSRKSKAIKRQVNIASPSAPADVMKPAPATPMTTVARPAAAPARATAGVKTVSYPYIGSELRRIALLTGIILVILIVLSIALK